MIKSLLMRHSLARRLVVGFVCISILPLSGLAVLNFTNFETAMTNTAVVNMAAIADKKTNQITHYINERRNSALFLSHSPELVSRYRGLQIGYHAGLYTKNYQQAALAMTNFLNQVIDETQSDDVFLIDKAGKVLFSLRKGAGAMLMLQSSDYQHSALEEGVAQAMQTLSVNVTLFQHYTAFNDKPAVFVIAPVLKNGVVQGALALEMNLKNFTTVITDNTGLGRTGETVFAQKTQLDHDKILYTTSLRYLNDAAFRHIEFTQVSSAMQHALSGDNGQGSGLDYAQRSVITAWRYLPDLHWGMVVKMDIQEALAPLTRLKHYSLWMLDSVLILVTVMAFVLFDSIIQPVRQLIVVADSIANGDLSLRVISNRHDEFGQLAQAFNHMTDEIQRGHDTLEQRVAQRTEELLTAKTQAVAAFNLLQQTQDSLVQAEKMAALGGLVAGVAHEINTPVGITLTSATHLQAETEKVRQLYAQGELSGDELDSYFDIAVQSSHLMSINSHRAADLIQSFKQVAVDQSSAERREFNMKDYIEDILLSLRPKLKKSTLSVQLDCPAQLIINSYAGALSQLLTNFIMNSLLHGYDAGQQGLLHICVNTLSDDSIELIYSDDGKGIAPDLHRKIFDPFFTTQRGSGGSGLGLHIVYNIVTQTLHGSLQLISDVGKGTTFIVHFPRVL